MERVRCEGMRRVLLVHLPCFRSPTGVEDLCLSAEKSLLIRAVWLLDLPWQSCWLLAAGYSPVCSAGSDWPESKYKGSGDA